MRKEKKGMNTYLKFGLVTLGFAFIGGVIGLSIVAFDLRRAGESFGGLLRVLRANIFPMELFLTVLTVIHGEMTLHRMRALGGRFARAEDEEGDILEYEIEQAGSAGMIVSQLLMIFSILVLSTGYSFAYIESMEQSGSRLLLAAMAVFIAEQLYCGAWQVRYVKLTQRIYPEKKGDPSSMKFQKQWLESCDEAERVVIYQSAYASYMASMRLLPTLTVVAMITHLVWNTGIMAVFVLCVLWITITVTYCASGVKKRGQRINKC